jgi:uncharacterized protein (TIGR02246 family)
MNNLKLSLILIAALFIGAGSTLAAPAVNQAQQPQAEAAIAAGNDAWMTGMKKGNAGLIADTFTLDAVDCGPDGDCAHGREAIQKKLQAELAKYGAARVATVHSLGSVQAGNFIYEWGTAGMVRGNGQVSAGRYLAVWRHEADGGWKLYRNLSLPNPETDAKPTAAI